MRAWCLALLPTIGCAQLFGIEDTTSHDAGGGGSDAPRIDARNDAPVDMKLPCMGGDTRTTDPMSGACYMLFTTPRSYAEARTVCGGLGGGALLASVQTANENQLITTLLGQGDAFLGGTDEQVEGTFRWEDGTAVVLTNWNTGEPNNGQGMYEEDCIVIHGSLAGKWDDRPCATNGSAVPGTYPFVCERD
jgi:hypothetical protein